MQASPHPSSLLPSQLPLVRGALVLGASCELAIPDLLLLTAPEGSGQDQALG